MSHHLLVVGLPRSGSTWLCRVLGLCRRHELILEPDNEKVSWPAWRLKRHLPRFPTLVSGQIDPSFRQLWRYAFNGRGARWACRGLSGGYFKLRKAHAESVVAKKEREAEGSKHAVTIEPAAIDRLLWSDHRVGAPRLAKSVHIPFCAEWVAEQIEPGHVLVILRHPLSTIASMKRLGMHDSFRLGSLRPHLTPADEQIIDEYYKGPGGPYDIRLVALHVLKMHEHLRAAALRHPEWTMIRFEDLCASPIEAYRALFDQIGYRWQPSLENQLAAMNQPGSGYDTRRIAGQQIDNWKRELSSEEIAAIEALFPNVVAANSDV